MIRSRLSNKSITPDIIANAQRILKELYHCEFGAEREFVSSGKRYVGVLEEHNRAKPEGNKPVGKHKGISVFALVEAPPKP